MTLNSGMREHNLQLHITIINTINNLTLKKKRTAGVLQSSIQHQTQGLETQFGCNTNEGSLITEFKGQNLSQNLRAKNNVSS